MTNIRHRIDPLDVPPVKAARRLGLSLAAFQEKLPRLLVRGFPSPDPDTGNFGLEAIDFWRRARDRHPQGELTPAPPPANDGPSPTMGERFREAQERRRHGRVA